MDADINIGNFQTITIANPDALTVGLIPTITVDTALAFKDFGVVTEADGFSNFETIIGSASGTNTIDGTLDELLSNSYNVDLSQQLLTVSDINDPAGDRTFNVVNFTDVIGTANDDVIVGSSVDNTFGGSLGNDSFDGGDGFDTVDFSNVKDNLTKQVSSMLAELSTLFLATLSLSSTSRASRKLLVVLQALTILSTLLLTNPTRHLSMST